jgi:hypothetical protein
MNRYVQLLVVILGLLSGTPLYAAAIGMVMDMSGSGIVRAKLSDQNVSIDVASALASGTSIDMEKSAEISFVFYPTRQQFTVTGPAALTLTEKGVQQTKGVAMKVENLPNHKATAALSFQNRVVPAALLMRTVIAKPQLLFPQVGETILTFRPVFAWLSDTDGMVDFSLTFAGASVYAQRLKSEELSLPADLVLLAGGEYRWQIKPVIDGTGTTIFGTFKVADDALQKEVLNGRPPPQADVSEWVYFAMALDQEKMLSEANQIWRRISVLRPASKKIKSLAK